MDSEELVPQFRRFPETRKYAERGAFDAADPLQVDEVAGKLLGRFRREDDLAAFELLVSVTERHLTHAALAIQRDIGFAGSAADLVAAFFATLYTDVRRNVPEVRHVLDLGQHVMHEIAIGRVAELAAGEGAWPADLRGGLFERSGEDRGAKVVPGKIVPGPPAPTATGPPAQPEADSPGPAAFGATYLGVFERAFHQLSEQDRRLLIAVDVDGLSQVEIARRFFLPRGDVGRLVARARLRLSALIAAGFHSPDSPPEDVP